MGLGLLEGMHLVQVYAERCGAPRSIVIAEDFLPRDEAGAIAARFDDDTLVVPRRLFDDLGRFPADVGIIAVIDVPRPKDVAAPDFCLLLDGVQDPGNVGSIVRSAAAAGVARVLLSKDCAFAWSPKVLRAGQGAHFHLDIEEDVDLPAWCGRYRGAGGRVVASVAQRGARIFDADLEGRVAIAIGNEGAGLSADLLAQADLRVTIPMPGGTESLNVAAAAAVALYECVRQRS